MGVRNRRTEGPRVGRHWGSLGMGIWVVGWAMFVCRPRKWGTVPVGEESPQFQGRRAWVQSSRPRPFVSKKYGHPAPLGPEILPCPCTAVQVGSMEG